MMSVSVRQPACRRKGSLSALALVAVIGLSVPGTARAGSLMGDFPTSVLDAFENIVGNDLGVTPPAWQPTGDHSQEEARMREMMSRYFGIDVTAFDMAGFRLYMKPESVRTLASQGNIPVFNAARDDESQELRSLSLQLSADGQMVEGESGPVPRESLDAGFGVGEQNVVRRLTLTFHYASEEERSQLVTAAFSKFGEPSAVYSDNEMAWGLFQVTPEGRPTETLDTSRPNLRMTVADGTLMLTLIDPAL